MKRIGTMAACAIAATAIGAAAESASARLPEWGKCEATNGSGGRYIDAGCTARAHRVKGVLSGGFEWTSLPTTHGTEISVSAPLVFETASGARIECASMDPAAVGESGRDESYIPVEGARRTTTPLWVFWGCHSEGTGEGHECRNTVFNGQINNRFSWQEEHYIVENEEEEEIETSFVHGWKGELGYVSGRGGAEPAVGLSLTPNNKGKKFEEIGGARAERFIDPPIVCESAIGTVWIGGEPQGGNSVIATIQPVNQMSSSYSQTYSESGPGAQEPAKFERGHDRTLQALIHNHWEPVAIVGTMSWQVEEGSEAIEIKATP